jgi:Family of unknown function (DUF5317)
MFLGLMALLVMATVPLTRGRLEALADVRLSWLPLLLAALLAQILITVTFPSLPDALLAGIHIATYVAAGWVLWANRRIPGIGLIALGAALNALPIIVNRGTLPATSSAEQSAGVHVTHHFTNSGVLAHPHLAFLGDTMTSPAFLPLRNVVSPGDLVILAGLAVLVHVTCDTVIGRLLVRAWRRLPALPTARRRLGPAASAN